MHDFHEYISKQLSELFKKRRVIVFYDPRKELAPFIDELPILEEQGAGVAFFIACYSILRKSALLAHGWALAT